MVKPQPPEPDFVARNVTLHSQGRREYGVLELHSHHLVFRYRPNDTDRGHARSGQQNRNVSGQATFVPEGASGTRDTIAGNDAHPQPARVFDKAVHVGYPLINHCYLRPSHAISATTRPTDSSMNNMATTDDDDLFPPTHGTNSTRVPNDPPRLATNSSPHGKPSPSKDDEIPSRISSGRQPAIRMRCKDFRIMAFHFHQGRGTALPDETARAAFYMLRSRCTVDKVEDLYAFQYVAPKEELAHQNDLVYDARREFARMGIGGKSAEGPGSAWRITEINSNYEYSPTYPSILCVPRNVSDAVLKYGGKFRSKARIPTLAYLHPNGGSITRASQPMRGVKGNRSAQDERLVSSIFTSQIPTTRSRDPPEAPLEENYQSALDSQLPADEVDVNNDLESDETSAAPRLKIYGSTSDNWILDARPKMNAIANQLSGGGMEDLKHYINASGHSVKYSYLNIDNIHKMRKCLSEVVAALANSDYLNLSPNVEALRQSQWLDHIANMLQGANHAAKVVGLGASHVLVHCSDGWDRTAQISALAQVMLSPYYRTLDGFITLVQKDFISFGHKFRDRNGIEGTEKWFEIENERIAPDNKENSGGDVNSINNIGVKAFSGAKNWFEKNKGNFFKQQNLSRDSLGDNPGSRPASPPPNSIIHSMPSQKEKKEHKMDEAEVAPIFHQFLDAVYQLLYQYPEAFEFNERFLKRLFYQVYATQYGEFLFNNERERAQYAGRTTTVWAHFLARRAEMTNPGFIPKVDDPLLLPKRDSEDNIEVRWWASLFNRKDEEMNVPRTVSSFKPPKLQVEATSVSVDDGVLNDEAGAASTLGNLREAKSTPTLSNMNSTLSSLSSISISRHGSASRRDPSGIHVPVTPPEVSSAQTQTTKSDLSPRDGQSSESASVKKASSFETPHQGPIQQESVAITEEGDPLGALSTPSKQAPKQSVKAGLDFATFATQNAFSER